MAQTIKKNLFSQALTVTTNNIEALDVTNHVGVSVTVRSPAGGAGSVKLQMSNIGNSATATDWTDVPTTICATGTLVASGSVTISTIAGIRAAFVRAVVTVSAGAGNYDIYYVAKEY